MKRFNPSEIEPKWQKKWDESHVYEVNLESDKPKYFSMGMFNYPSGAGIHVGHALNYTIPDVMARYKRQQGYESYHPVGWDSFGLPAENYAIKTGISPQASMKKIIPSYHQQYKAMGWSNDWSKEIATHTPEYYKWTQWIFAEMYRADLAYQEPRMQWWCDGCQTVLANEQVIDGKCWRHDTVDDPIVEKKEVKQWFFKITEYADEILEATADLDWTQSVKLAQKNWIGKSVGAEITFKTSSDDITVFTTRPDTIFGATFLVLAPEHPLVESLVNDDTKMIVEEYVRTATKKSELERMADSKEKTGVFTGSHAVNPATGDTIPIWIADYVLFGYGTGSIMAVPAHDERDLAFAEKYRLKVIEVVSADTEDERVVTTEGTLQNSGMFDGMTTSDAREQVVEWLEEQGIGKTKTTYKMRDWSVSRQRYWGAPIPIIHCASCGPQLVEDNQLPVVLPELDDFQPSGDGRSALARASDWLNVNCPSCGGEAQRETDTLDTYICSSWYYLRYLDPMNTDEIIAKSIAQKWMPVDFYNGADHATAHLLYARFVARFLHKTHGIGSPEPFKKFLFNGKVTAQSGEMFSKSKGNGVDPLEIINSGYGADALRTYLMFAAPLDTWVRWDSQGVPGTHRFLNRIWNLVQEYLEASQTGVNDEITKAIHPVIQKVTHDLEHQKFNTAIAAMMELTNKLYVIKANDGFSGADSWQFALSSLVSLIAPFAPHMADELWEQLGNEGTVQRDSWPKWDDAYLVSDTMKIAVQINGKLRTTLEFEKGTDDAAVESAVLSDEKVLKYLEERKPTKVIYIKGRIINLVL